MRMVGKGVWPGHPDYWHEVGDVNVKDEGLVGMSQFQSCLLFHEQHRVPRRYERLTLQI